MLAIVYLLKIVNYSLHRENSYCETTTCQLVCNPEPKPKLMGV